MSQEWVFVLVGLAAFVGTIAWGRMLGRLNERGSRRRGRSREQESAPAIDSGGSGTAGVTASAKAAKSGGSTAKRSKPRRPAKRRRKHHR